MHGNHVAMHVRRGQYVRHHHTSPGVFIQQSSVSVTILFLGESWLLTIFIPSCVLPHRIVSQVFACQHVLHVMHAVHVAFYCEFYNLIFYMSTFILYM